MIRISKSIKDKKVAWSRWHEFTKGKLCLANLITIFSEMSGLVNEGRAVDMVCLDFSKAFDTISHDILLDKLMKYKIEWWTVTWIENWAMVGRALPAG